MEIYIFKDLWLTMFTYLIPCKDNPELLTQTLNSIDFDLAEVDEVIVVDDYSSRPLSDELNFNHKKLRLIKNAGLPGIVGALNYGASFVCSKYILRLDSDDLDFPDRIQKTKCAINKFSDADIISFGKENFPKSIATNVYWRNRKELEALLIFGNPIYHPTVCIKSSVFDLIEYSENIHKNTQLAPGVEDYLFWCNAFLKGMRIYNYPEIVIKYREWDGQVSRKRYTADPASNVGIWFQKNLNRSTIASLYLLLKIVLNTKNEKYGTGIVEFCETSIKRRYGSSKLIFKFFWIIVYLFYKLLRK